MLLELEKDLPLMSNTKNKQQTPFRLGCAFLLGDHPTRRKRLHYNNNSMQNTIMYETYYHKSAEKLDPTGERATKQEVEALLARQQDMLGLELNEQGVKPSTGSGDPEEEIETAQLAVLIQRACVAGSAALTQGDFPATQRFFLTCHHAARFIAGEAQRRREIALVGKEYQAILGKNGDSFSVLSKESKDKMKQLPQIVKFMSTQQAVATPTTQQQNLTEQVSIPTAVQTVMPQFQNPNNFANQQRYINPRQQQRAQFFQNQAQFGQNQNQSSWFRSGPFKRNRYGFRTDLDQPLYQQNYPNSFIQSFLPNRFQLQPQWSVGPQQSLLPFPNYQSSSHFVPQIPAPFAQQQQQQQFMAQLNQVNNVNQAAGPKQA
ncbi:MAG: hypothetical protein EZS28_033889 [Streblomastix strix]|uniref:Uncharacterized protein n=1 Tax=Streblomastix strix TaxID=222440 RepID=A0A5J4UK27_9EUKA|nr:MAG: hypothetical protein EZS28_033889 [Streblomastix strix]